jgi:hypothetical protein
MEKYTVTGGSTVSHVIDSNPQHKWIDQICTIYERTSPLKSQQVCNSLNMAHELRQLSPSATKTQMLEIINKYR